MKNMSALDDLKFDMEGGKYSELADALQHWAECFWEGTLDDAYADNLAYLLYNMSKTMRDLTDD